LDKLFGLDLIEYLWVGLATLVALPGALFVTWISVSRLRFLSLVAATIGTVVGYFVTFFVWLKALDGIHLEGAVVFSVAFFVCSVTGLTGALLINFLAGSGPRPRSTQVEF
jgi:hypothetical protein